MEKAIEKALEGYPEFLTSEHLVKLGLYKSIDAAYQARLNGHSPVWIKMKHLVLYPKASIVEFFCNRLIVPREKNDIEKESGQQ